MWRGQAPRKVRSVPCKASPHRRQVPSRTLAVCLLTQIIPVYVLPAPCLLCSCVPVPGRPATKAELTSAHSAPFVDDVVDVFPTLTQEQLEDVIHRYVKCAYCLLPQPRLLLLLLGVLGSDSFALSTSKEECASVRGWGMSGSWRQQLSHPYHTTCQHSC